MEKRQGIQVYSAIKIYDGKPVATSQMISEEMPLTIYLNGKELVTMLCSPVEQKYLALGFLVSEGMIACQEDLTQFMLDEERGLIWAEAETVPANAGQMYFKRCLSACCGRGRAEFYFANDARVSKRIDSELRIGAGEVNFYAQALEEASATHHITSGVHNGAVAADGKLLCCAEDIGRHNVFDKLYGKCLEQGVTLADKVLVFSGRVSSEIILKVSKMGVPIVIARSVPTSLAIDLAEELGITLIGVAKGDWFNIYAQANRVICCAE